MDATIGKRVNWGAFMKAEKVGDEYKRSRGRGGRGKRKHNNSKN